MRNFLFLAVFVCFISAGVCRAESLATWGVETAVYRSQAVVRAVPLANDDVKIKQVWNGSLKKGQQIHVGGLSNLPTDGYESEKAANEALWKQIERDSDISTSPGHADSTDTSADDLVLFLEKDAKGGWQTCGWGAGAKRLHGDIVYRYAQIMNPGGYWLCKDADFPRRKQLEAAIKKALLKQRRYCQAVALKNPNLRAQALANFVQPDEKTYFYEAIQKLAKTGDAGAQIMMQQAELPQQKARRNGFLFYMGVTKSPSVATYLLRCAQLNATIAKKISVPVVWEKLNEAERTTLSEWQSALEGLNALKDARALPLLRDALVWGAPNERSLFNVAVTGLQNQPDRENIAAFAQALPTLPFRLNSPYDKQICLRALSENLFRESVPVLADYLISPAADGPTPEDTQQTIRIVHQALVNIVKKDLGSQREPWIRWFQHPEEFKDFPLAPEQTIWY